MNNSKKLKILPVNKTVVFNSPMEGDDVLVRTGTITEGSSFFHALLHSYSNEYVAMNKKERMQFVRRLRGSMAGKIDMDSWEEMVGGLIAKISLKEIIHIVLYNFNLFLLEQDEKVRGRATRKTIKLLVTEPKDIEVYQLILSIIPVEKIESAILQNAYERSDGKSIKKTIDYIVEDGISYLNSLPELNSIPSSKREYLTNVFIIFLKVVSKESHKEAYKKYIKGIENTKEDVDNYTIDFICKRFNRDIYFIDGDTRVLHNNFSPDLHLRGRKSIIVICINKKHYEIVGRLLPGNKIQRDFDSDDSLITKFNMFLLHPERLHSNYPELREYTHTFKESPVRFKMKSKNSDSDSENESIADSDHYYDSSDDSSDSE